MNGDELLDRLARRARKAPPASCQVFPRVWTRICARQREEILTPFVWFAAVSALAASVASALTPSLYSLLDACIFWSAPVRTILLGAR